MAPRTNAALKPWFAFPVAAAITLGACEREGREADSTAALCAAETIPIHSIQGDGFQSPLLGRVATVRGVVTHVGKQGLFLESEAPDDSQDTSEGLYVQAEPPPDAAHEGVLLAVSGTVAELGEGRDTLTALTNVTSARGCATGIRLPLTPRRLPMSDLQKEASEGMRIGFEQPLAVSGVYRLRRGELLVSADGPLPAPTEVARPGADAREQGWLNQQRAMSVRLADAVRQPFPVGTSILRMEGVLAHDGRQPQLLLADDLNPAPPGLPTISPPAAGDVRVVALNLHNYFNGDGEGGGFPTARGAETPAEFERQRRRLAATVAWSGPHIVAVLELENDGFGPRSAAADFLRDLGSATGQAWQVVDPGVAEVGTDQIRVGLFYRPDRVSASGDAHLLEGPPFDVLNRVPMAQVFTDRPTGESFLLVVNHFKSKGSCPASGMDADNRDGQGCWNRARVAAADAVTRWSKQLAGELADQRALLIGDFNAYRLENPIRYILDAGFTDLTAPAGLGHEYTFVYWGASGTLDYAFASARLQPFVWRAQILHSNAGYPPGLALEHEWLRSSDHDPVLVDLRFSQSSTSF